MARVKIRGRAEILELDDDRAQTLKNRKFGLNGAEKADPYDLVDLGEWAGEYGRITEIEIPPQHKQKSYSEQQAVKEKAEEEKWLKQSPEVKAQGVNFFKLQYAMRVGDYKAQPPEDLLKKVVEAQVKFFAENPTELRPSIECYGDLLPPKSERSVSRLTLTKKMSDPAAPNGKECEQCKKPLTGNQKRFCSGTCMLAHENGEVSTADSIDSADNSN